MAVLAVHELSRQLEHEFGDTPRFVRRFVLTLDNPATTTIAQATAAAQVSNFGTFHPDAQVPLLKAEVNENFNDSRYHWELVAYYYYPENPDDLIPNPVLRPDVWTFQTQGSQVAALFYFPNNNNNSTQAPLTNSAFDFFEGVTGDEAQNKITITGNRNNFPVSLATAVTNCINVSNWIGFPPRTVKCQGVSAELKRTITTSGTVQKYWEQTVELLYRQTGWDLLLPDVGFNFISGGQKRRVMTFDDQNLEWIPSPVPMGLNGSGAQTFSAPAILQRRIYKEINFTPLFGSPPT